MYLRNIHRHARVRCSTERCLLAQVSGTYPAPLAGTYRRAKAPGFTMLLAMTWLNRPPVFSLSDVRAGQPTLCNAEGWSLQDTLRRWSSRAMGVTAPKNASPKTKSNIIAFAPRRVWQSATNLVMALRCRWPQSQLSPPFLLALQSARQPQSASELQRANARSWSRRASSNGATGSRT
jgi:hypothetical protein